MTRATGSPPGTSASDELGRLLFQQDGVISVRQALCHLSQKAIRHRIATGRWQRTHRSVIITHSGPATPVQLHWAAALAVGEHAVVGGLTAAEAAGLRGYGTPTVHLLLPAHRQARSVPPGVVVHRSTTLNEHDILAIGRPPRTRAARSLVDAAQWAAGWAG